LIQTIIQLNQPCLRGLKLACQFTLTSLQLLHVSLGLFRIQLRQAHTRFEIFSFLRIGRFGSGGTLLFQALLDSGLLRTAMIQFAPQVVQLPGDTSHQLLLQFEPLDRDLDAGRNVRGALKCHAELVHLH